MAFDNVLGLTVLLFSLTSVYCAVNRGCVNAVEESEFPPKEFHLVLNDTYIKGFDEVFVIGDVHGCFDELQLLLRQANAESNKVLKILTGDFLRKGPKNMDVLRYLQKSPSAITVRGNNDQKVLIRHGMSKKSSYTLLDMDKFIKDLTKKDLEWIQELPYTISIPSMNIIIVHAGLIPSIALSKNFPFDMMNVRNFIYRHQCPGHYSPQKGTKNGGDPWATKWRGPQHIVFGHDHKRQLQFHPFATGLDSSCVYGHYLTGLFIKGPRTGTVYQQPALGKYFSHHDDKIDKESPPEEDEDQA